MTRRRVCVALALLLALAPRVSAQIVAGQLPQLPAELGPNGGLKVECIAGTCTGGGGVGADVNITAVGGNALTTAVPVSGTVAATNANLDIALSALRDAIVGAGPKTLSDIVTALGLLATTAKQDTGNTSLNSIDGKTPALGQALAANSVPVILPALTVTALTPPAAITGFALESSQLTGNTSLGTINTNTAPLVTAGAGGYVRQDSTATIAKESGGNLATLVTNTTGLATAGNQTTEIGSLATVATNTTTLANAIATPGSAVPTRAELSAGADPQGLARTLATTAQGALYVQSVPALSSGTPLLAVACNALRRTNCR